MVECMHACIVNVTVSAKLPEPLDLDVIHKSLRDVQYQPSLFCGLLYRRQNPKATIIMFTTGKLVSVGTRSEEEAKLSIRRTIEELGLIRGKSNLMVKTENVVATADFEINVDLDSLLLALKNSTYEPEQFPALIHRLDGATALIFNNGKVCLSGAKSEAQATKALSLLYKRIQALLPPKL